MISDSVIKECAGVDEASVKDYLNRFFFIKEYDFSQFRDTVLAETQSMLVEDIDKIPGTSFNRISWLNPVDSTQTPDAIVEMRHMDVPKSLGDIKCYRFTLRYSVDAFIRQHYLSPLEKVDREAKEEALFIEEKRINILSVFHFSSLLPFLHRQCPIIDKAIGEYGKFESLEELQRLVASVN